MTFSKAKDPLDVLRNVHNEVLLQTGKALREASKDGKGDLVHINKILRARLPATVECFNTTLNDLESEITKAKAALMRDLNKVRKAQQPAVQVKSVAPPAPMMDLDTPDMLQGMSELPDVGWPSATLPMELDAEAASRHIQAGSGSTPEPAVVAMRAAFQAAGIPLPPPVPPPAPIRCRTAGQTAVALLAPDLSFDPDTLPSSSSMPSDAENLVMTSRPASALLNQNIRETPATIPPTPVVQAATNAPGPAVAPASPAMGDNAIPGAGSSLPEHAVPAVLPLASGLFTNMAFSLAPATTETAPPSRPTAQAQPPAEMGPDLDLDMASLGDVGLAFDDPSTLSGAPDGPAGEAVATNMGGFGLDSAAGGAAVDQNLDDMFDLGTTGVENMEVEYGLGGGGLGDDSSFDSLWVDSNIGSGEFEADDSLFNL